MRPLENIQISLSQIKHIIQSNEKVRKLLTNDSLDPLSGPEVNYIDAEEHIYNAAVFDLTIPPYNKNTLITITLMLADNDEDIGYQGVVRINVITKTDLWKIANNKLRPLELCSLIIEDLNNFKLQTSQKIFFETLEFMLLDGNINGYSITFHLLEGSGLDDQF